MPVSYIKKPKSKTDATDFDKHISSSSTEPITLEVEVSDMQNNMLSHEMKKVGEVTLASSKSPAIPFASVSYMNGYTKNVGNFESFKIQVSVTVPCSVTKLEDGYKLACDFVEKALTEKLEEIEKDFK